MNKILIMMMGLLLFSSCSKEYVESVRIESEWVVNAKVGDQFYDGELRHMRLKEGNENFTVYVYLPYPKKFFTVKDGIIVAIWSE